MASLKSWFPIPKSSHFSLANLPFGIISTASKSTPHPAVAIGEHCLDLQEFAASGAFSSLGFDVSCFSKPTLNDFAALGRPVHRSVRKYLQDVFVENTSLANVLQSNKPLQQKCLIPREQVEMHMPMHIGDYTDFYAGKNHAFNVGCLFRGPDNALQPNYTHLPVGYHGRASSVVISGTPITRPNGQILENPAATPKIPIFSACRRLDIELELGAFLCKGNKMGTNIPISEAADHIFGFVLLNDWSARDIQAWEYVPLGPFLAKNFGSTISPWVVLTDALEPFRCKGIPNETKLLPYLQEQTENNVYDIRLQVDITPENESTTTILNSNGRNLLFSFPQMLAHHSIGGCPMAVGDLLGSGTISGTEAGTEGSMLEITKGGKESIKLNGGVERKFLEDGDTITMYGVCGTEESGLVGFGECSGKILPAPKI
ncbi:fumarylacetoacetase [Cladophialophora bantiana CBS 173.52]|uniref:Fumarylacetoacetase n=1 Tax=Cladophialophora bantiana (strain ATCC 10958 / CBS 173.52 / CDC B-1940 / NIH 8579) TaxID=1442370 RepID=A0A0D2EYX1_CLAB1|nr:fumarylacetoacetase [Cladophialophora bantiana CBS 173.52]KIW95171.1 fumarylacetoacetase [Cladophialophora bantiana CBS 173.52]